MQAILHELTVNDNAVRVRAEEKLIQGMQAQPNELIVALCQECGNHGNLALQGLAIVLLRRLILQEESLWAEKLSPSTKSLLKNSLLALLDSAQMTNESNRKKLCDTIANIAYQEDEWNELLPFLFRTAQPQCTQVQKENALELFSNLSHFILAKLQNNFASAAQLLHTLHSASEPLSVRLAATRATWDVVLACNTVEEAEGTEANLTMFEPLIESSLEVLSVSLDQPRVEETLECFIDLASTGDARRWFAKQRLERTLLVMIQVCNSAPSPAIRILAMECIVSLMESRGGAIRKMHPPQIVLQQVIPILVKMMTSLPELKGSALQAWGERYPANFTSSTASFHAEDQDDCEGDMESFGASLEYADRITRALKPKNVLPLFFQTCTALLQDSANWQSQHAALLLVAHIVEFVTKKEPELGEICALACQCANTPGAHMRVRHAAFTLIGRVSLDCCPEVQTRHSRMIIQSLLVGLRDQVPRVQAHASVALVNYCFGMDDDDSEEAFELGLKPYLREVLLTLFDALKSTHKEVVQENVISAIAHVAKCAGQEFHPFYSEALQPLKQALEALPFVEEKYGLRARLVDCISLIGLSVGKERFFPDAAWLIQLLQRTPLNAEDDNVMHVQQAWVRLAEVLGEDLGSYLPVIVPFVIEIAQRDNLDQGQDDDDDEDDMGGDENAAALELVRTAAVDDRLNALDSLAKFAKHCKQAFWPFYKTTLEIFIRDVNVESSDLESVRELAAEGLPDLVQCLLASRKAGVVNAEVFQHVLHQMLSTICVSCNTEDSMEVLKRLVHSLRYILVDCQQASNNVSTGVDVCPDYVDPCAMLLMTLMKESMQRRAVEMATFKCDQLEQEADNEAEMDYMERITEEHDLQLSISACMGELIKANRNSFVTSTLNADVGKQVLEMTHPNRVCHDQKIAIYILDDVLEYCALEQISPALLQTLGDLLARAVAVEKSTSPQESQSEVAQLVHAAAYGLGVCAQRFGQIPPHAVESLVRLLVQTPKSLVEQEESYGFCLDNAASALFKVAKYAVKQDELYSVWLDAMPMQYDLQESRINTLCLIQMLDEERHPYFQSEQVLAKVVRVLSMSIGNEYLEDAHMDRALKLVKQIQDHVGADFFKRHVPASELERLRVLTQ